jgi:hypothetical protein
MKLWEAAVVIAVVFKERQLFYLSSHLQLVNLEIKCRILKIFGNKRCELALIRVSDGGCAETTHGQTVNKSASSQWYPLRLILR